MGRLAENPKNTVFSFRTNDVLAAKVERAASRSKDLSTFLCEAVEHYADFVIRDEEETSEG